MKEIGYWLPHSSSVDFCEPNYQLSYYVVEPHNVWSSLFITILGVLGCLFSNPTQEIRFYLMYIILSVIGLGSVGLHTSLNWVLQSSDEIPMLWLSVICLYGLYEAESPRGHPRLLALPGFTGCFLIIQTYVYYRMQHLYVVFIVSIIVAIVLITIWTGRLCFDNTLPKEISEIRKGLWIRSFSLFVLIGAVLWIIDMNFCDELLPYYRSLYGMTLHVVWHIASGLGTYVHICLQIAIRLQSLKKSTKFRWVMFGLIPIITSKQF